MARGRSSSRRSRSRSSDSSSYSSSSDSEERAEREKVKQEKREQREEERQQRRAAKLAARAVAAAKGRGRAPGQVCDMDRYSYTVRSRAISCDSTGFTKETPQARPRLLTYLADTCTGLLHAWEAEHCSLS